MAGQQQQQAAVNVDPASAVAQMATRARWLFAVSRLRDTPSIRDGFTPEKEMRYRQQAASIIQEMAEKLNHNVIDKRSRLNQHCICASVIHMHRFYVFHSFKMFDPRDIGAACLFLAGKAEECPRKLEHIVKVWWSLKFPDDPHLDIKSDRYMDAANLIVTYENVILQTVAFDLHVEVPHPHVLYSMKQIAPRGNRSLSETAYWFASDILHLTNWCVRYSARTLACVCIHMACVFADCEIPMANDGRPWYFYVEPSMTQEQLDELATEFTAIYRSCKHNVKKLVERKSLAASVNAAKQNALPSADGPSSEVAAVETDTTVPSSSTARHPVAPVVQQRKAVDLSQYKIRRNAQQQQQKQPESDGPSDAPVSVEEQPKRNFMPDISRAIDVLANMHPIQKSAANLVEDNLAKRPKNHKGHESNEKMKNYKTRDDQLRKRASTDKQSIEPEYKQRRIEGHKAPSYHTDGPSSSSNRADYQLTAQKHGVERLKNRKNKSHQDNGSTEPGHGHKLITSSSNRTDSKNVKTSSSASDVSQRSILTSGELNNRKSDIKREKSREESKGGKHLPYNPSMKAKSDWHRSKTNFDRSRISGSGVKETNGVTVRFQPPLPIQPPPPIPPPPSCTDNSVDEKEDGEID